MELKVSKPVKIFALVALVGGLGFVAWLTFLGPSGGGADPSALGGIQLDAQGRVIAAPTAAGKVAAKANRRIAAPKTALKPPAAASSRKTSAARPIARRVPSAVAPNGLPGVVAAALERHSSVVVALFAPDGKIDGMGFAEAKEGAALARAGFVPVNVFDTRTAGPLMTKLGVVLRAPAVLVFTRSGELSMRIDGFADRQTVAQAALSAGA